MKPSFTCWILMLTVAPLTVSAALFIQEPSRWGSGNPLNIIVMAVFGLMSVPLWPTYIPALVFTPILMKRLSMSARFLRLSPLVLSAGSLVSGAIAGLLVLLPMILLSLDTQPLVVQWMTAGALAGAITLTAIVFVYRKANREIRHP